MCSEFKQQLKIQMHAREVSSFDSWARYLFFTSVQRAVHSDGDSSSDDANKDGKRKLRSLKISQTESEIHLRICFQTASSPKTVSGQRTRVTVFSTSTIYSAPMGTSVSATIPITPNRRLRSSQRTVRIHPKCERSKPRCASCLRRKIDCSRRRSPSSSAAARMMIHTRHLHCVRLVPPWAPAARALEIECNSAWLNSTWFDSAQLNLVQLNSVQLSKTQLGLTQLGSTQLGSTQLGSTQLGSTQHNSTWLNSTWLNSTWLNSTSYIGGRGLLNDRTGRDYLD